MAKAKLPALNAKAPVQFPPSAMNAREQENSLPRKACWNATFATAAASCPSNATNASVAVNSSVKHAAEQAVKRAILRFRLNRHGLRNSLKHKCCCVRCNAIREARKRRAQPPVSRACCVMKATLISNQEKYPFLRELGIQDVNPGTCAGPDQLE